MKPMIGIFLLLFSVMEMGSVATVCAQHSYLRQRAEADSVVNPPLAKQADSLLRFSRTVIDAGTMTEDDAPRTFRFEGVNVSRDTLTLVRIQSSCGCMPGKTQLGKIAPGERRNVEVTYHPHNHPGTINSNAFVYVAEAGKSPVARLTLIGNVLPGADEWARYPYAMGKLRLKQREMTFARTAGQSQMTERILCGNSGNKPLRLKALLLPPYAEFRTEPQEIAPGEEADIVISIDFTKLPAGKSDTFTFPVIINGVDARPTNRTLTVKVTSPQ